MQRRDDPAARLTRSSGRSGSMDPSGVHPSVRQTPTRPSPLPHRSRGGGGGPRGGVRASPATQPPPLLPPSATGPDATVVGSAPTPLLPPSATAAAKMEPENKYLPELMAEKDSLDPSFTHAMQLLSVGKRVLAHPRLSRSWRWVAAALFLLLPPPRSPGIGSSLLDPGLQDPGPTSPTPAQGEEELRKGGDPKYAHLNMDLHVFIEVFGPPCEAYALMAHAMEEVKKFLVPDMMDDICQEQFLELSYLNGVPEPSRGRGVPVRGRGAAPPPPPVPRGRGVGPPRGALVRGTPVRGSITRGATVTRGVPPPPTVRGAPTPRARTAGIQRIPLPPPPAPETYEDYGYDDTYADQSYEGYEGYYSQSQGESEYYDYGHGEVQDSYEAYGQDDWNGTRPSLKAPPARPVKGSYREHPYGRY
ncbi:KH domain containing RNA binding signal transduction associated 1 [Cricetulus griseus]